MADTAFLVDEAMGRQLQAWLRDLSAVRRLAALTVEAYQRDVGTFLNLSCTAFRWTGVDGDAGRDARRRPPRLYGHAPRGRHRVALAGAARCRRSRASSASSSAKA